MAPPLTAIIAAIAVWLVIGTLGLVWPRDLRVVRALFPAGAIVAVAVAVLALVALADAPASIVLQIACVTSNSATRFTVQSRKQAGSRC